MKFDIVTLFPEMFSAMNFGVVGRAICKNIIDIKSWNPRDYTNDNYCKVDDRPYGGGAGMVMMAEPLTKTVQAINSSSKKKPLVIYLTPQGKVLNQQTVKQLSQEEQLILVAGRYEGIDERFIESTVDQEISIGDYVLSGGEFAIMVLIDAISRLLPGVLGDTNSAINDSFNGENKYLLEYPHYTRPAVFNKRKAPNILLTGNHKSIEYWRRQQSLGRTYLRRPDLLEKCELTSVDTMLLNEFIEKLDENEIFEVN